MVLVALGAFVLLGSFDGALGVAWPAMRSHFSRGVADLGLLLACGSVGYLVASIGYGRVHARVGTGLALTVGGGLLGIGALGFAVAPAFWVVSVSAVMLGLGGGLIDAGMNAHAALAFDIRSINLLHAAYGVGATAGPLVITLSLGAGGSWRAGYAVLALTQIGLLAATLRPRHSWSVSDAGAEEGSAPVVSRMVLLLAPFLVYTGVEVGAGQWAFTLLTESRGMSVTAAGTWVAAYWGGLTVGRFGLGLAGNRLAPGPTITTSLLVCIVGLCLLWWDPASLGVIGLPVAGLGLASVFPMLVSLTPARIGRSRATATVGYQLAAANLGAAALPWLFGVIAERRGLGTLAPSLLITAVALALLHVATERVNA
jgi:fucose permease